MNITRLYQQKPCKNCPFKKDTVKGWLNRSIVGILNTPSFVCHKTTSKQCAGHMILKGEDNSFVALATRLGYDLKLTGKDLIFSTEKECIEHHKER